MDETELIVDLRQMVMAMAAAVDLVGMNDTNHGKRVGYIALQMARQRDFDRDAQQFVFDLGLMHDCGVSTEQTHNNLVSLFDWEESDIHCKIGYRLLSGFEPLADFAEPILYHHTPWEELSALGVDGRVRKLANLIFLADRVDVTAAPHYGADVLLAKDGIIASIEEKSGVYFDPEWVAAFKQIASFEAFWISLEERHVTRFAWDMGRYHQTRTLNIAQLRQLALIFSYIVDQKSPFTTRHSERVGALARHIASLAGLSDIRCDKIEVAGYLHDLGKLHIPDGILEKPGPLSRFERSVMNQHSYETYEILRTIEGLDEITAWAAFHHDDLSRTGYPFHPKPDDLSVESRILAVADVFQALVQDRPYRAGMSREQVARILVKMANTGKLDRDIVDLALADVADCFAVASFPLAATDKTVQEEPRTRVH